MKEANGLKFSGVSNEPKIGDIITDCFNTSFIVWKKSVLSSSMFWSYDLMPNTWWNRLKLRFRQFSQRFGVKRK
jgi:hypothetical protein